MSDLLWEVYVIEEYVDNLNKFERSLEQRLGIRWDALLSRQVMRTKLKLVELFGGDVAL